MSRTRFAGIRITKVGLWFVLFSLVVGVAATNTGNNALYMVLAVMLAVLVLSGLVSRNNLRGVWVKITPPSECFANVPFRVQVRVANRGRLLSRFGLLFSLEDQATPMFISRLARRAATDAEFEGETEILIKRRGRHRLDSAALWSLFPLGFFRKGKGTSFDDELLVYPEIFSAASCQLDEPGCPGSETAHRAGWGHDLHALRPFRPGDDPRAIHWKQSARTASLVFKERAEEENRRLSIVLDNAVGELSQGASRQRFERLVSEAATAAVDYLARGGEVELVTRDQIVPFAGGWPQRTSILEALALLETRPRVRGPLEASSPSTLQLRLAFDERRAQLATAGAR